MFERIAIKWLRTWRNKPDRKPLIVRGARQVGKTSLIKTFAAEFDSFLSFNLDNHDDLQLFAHEMPIEELFNLMLAVRHVSKNGTTLVFIDEIQNSPTAIKMLRYFYEELPHIYVIAAGSLLETLLNRQISFPVGRVEYMALRPVSFTEFLGAIGERGLQNMVEEMSVPEVLHPRIMSLFNQYSLIGGMPEVVAHYAEHRDVVALDAIYETLLSGYIDDVEKYQKGETMRNILRFVISKGWQSAAQRITVEHFGNSNYKSREIGEAMRTLQKAMLLELVYPTTELSQPYSEDLRKKPKLMWLDTGLVNFAAGVQSELFGKRDVGEAWRGAIAEHVVGQELLTISPSFLERRRFWVREERNSQAEVDFLYKCRNGVLPIEVKSGHNAHLKSLQLFMNESKLNDAVRFWANPISEDIVATNSGHKFILHNLPYYYAGQIYKLLGNHSYSPQTPE